MGHSDVGRDPRQRDVSGAGGYHARCRESVGGGESAIKSDLIRNLSYGAGLITELDAENALAHDDASRSQRGYG